MRVVTLLDILWLLASGFILLVLSGAALYQMLIKKEPLRLDHGDLSYLPESWKRRIFDEKPKPKRFA
jgi:hypothetical protein